MFPIPPFNNFKAITVGTSNIYPDGSLTHAVWVGTGGGNMTVIDQAGTSVTFNNVVSGQLLPIGIARVSAVTGTVADLVALRRI